MCINKLINFYAVSNFLVWASIDPFTCKPLHKTILGKKWTTEIMQQFWPGSVWIALEINFFHHKSWLGKKSSLLIIYIMLKHWKTSSYDNTGREYNPNWSFIQTCLCNFWQKPHTMSQLEKMNCACWIYRLISFIPCWWRGRLGKVLEASHADGKPNGG